MAAPAAIDWGVGYERTLKKGLRTDFSGAGGLSLLFQACCRAAL